MISLLNEIKIKILSDFEQLKLLANKTFREIPKDIASARTRLNSEEKRGGTTTHWEIQTSQPH